MLEMQINKIAKGAKLEGGRGEQSGQEEAEPARTLCWGKAGQGLRAWRKGAPEAVAAGLHGREGIIDAST